MFCLTQDPYYLTQLEPNSLNNTLDQKEIKYIYQNTPYQLPSNHIYMPDRFYVHYICARVLKEFGPGINNVALLGDILQKNKTELSLVWTEKVQCLFEK